MSLWETQLKIGISIINYTVYRFIIQIIWSPLLPEKMKQKNDNFMIYFLVQRGVQDMNIF